MRLKLWLRWLCVVMLVALALSFNAFVAPRQVKAATTYTWNQTGTGSWVVATNWTPARNTPAADDILIFDGSQTPSPTITNIPRQTIGQLRIINNASVTFSSGIATAGTGTISKSSTTVTGVGTLFTSELVVGDIIYGNTTMSGYEVTAIANDTSLSTGQSTSNMSSQSFSIAPKLTIAGETGDDFVVESGSSLSLNVAAVPPIVVWLGAGATGRVSGNISFQGHAHRLQATDAGALVFESGATFTTNSNFTGNAFGATRLNSVIFTAGSTYTHNAGANPFGANAPNAVVVFQPDSTAVFRTTTGYAASGRTYANLVAAAALNNTGTSNFQFQNLTVEAGSSFTHAGSSTAAVTILGNISSAGTGNVSITAGSGGIIINSGSILTFGGGGGTGILTFGSSATIGSGTTVYLSRDVTVAAGTLTVNGDLYCGANAVAGTGNFTLASGATLGIGSPDGISAGTASGNIRVSGTRTFNAGANYIFNGSAAQTTGAGFPSTVNDLALANPSSVTLSAATTVNGILTLTSGRLVLNSINLTLGSYAMVNGLPDANTMIVIDGSGALCKTYNALGSFTFPIGETTDTAEYSPATANFNDIAEAGTICLRVVDAVHGSNPSTADYLSRYWEVTEADSFGTFNSTLTFEYKDSDIIGTTEGNMYGLKYDTTENKWTRFTQVNAAANTFQVSVDSFSDFTAGDYNPTAITLAAFSATPQNAAILVAWETASELDNVGFNLYRSEAADGPYVQLNTTLIPPQNPGSVLGGYYEWLDADVQPGVVYFYKLEDLDVKGVSTFHGPISTAVIAAPAAVGLRSLSARGLLLPLALGWACILGVAVARRRKRNN